MRKIIFLLLTATVLWSCQNANYTIQGTVADPAFEGTNVYLQQITDDGLQTVETTTVHNGTFSFTGLADENALRYVALNEQTRAPLLLERGTITVAFNDVITVSGTRLNTLLSEFRLKRDERNQAERALIDRLFALPQEEIFGAPGDEIRAARNQLLEERHNADIKFMTDNIGNEAGRYFLRNLISQYNFDLQDELLALTDDNFRAEPRMARVLTRIENSRNVAVGKPFVDFTMKDPEGNKVSLSDFAGQGNYVLLNFWATWCGPCIQSLPYLREAYARFHSRGFEIVGVSLDRDHNAWVNGLERLNITWPQMSDMMMWQSPVVDLYAFRGIPYSVLMNREGIIIAHNPRYAELSSILAELMP